MPNTTAEATAISAQRSISDVAPAGKRNRNLDVFRIVFALCVLLSHAPELTDGDKSRELLARFSHTSITLGNLGVDGFFLLSGYLITQSWESEPRLGRFLRKRLLRIVPGYLAAALLSVLIVGLVAPGTAHFFHKFNFMFPVSLLTLSYPFTPPVLPGMPYPSANGALWTINYEFRCYLGVALLGLSGILRKRHVVALFAAAALVGLLSGSRVGHVHLPLRLTLLLGDPFQECRLLFAYLVGVLFYLFRSSRLFHPLIASAAACLILVASKGGAFIFESVLIACGGYLLFYAGQLQWSGIQYTGRFPDISYGLYLYGWPVESLLIWHHQAWPWITFAEAAILSAALGWLSWRYIERPALRFKGSGSAPLPAG